MIKDNPMYEGRPVIVVHLAAKEGSNIAYCAPIAFRANPETYKDIPRAFCPACNLKMMKGQPS